MAHLDDFPSPDSDYDLRGVHLLPLREVVGLTTGQETNACATNCMPRAKRATSLSGQAAGPLSTIC